MHTFVTGRGGVVGSHLVAHFDDSAQFIVLGNFRSEFPLNIGECASTYINRRRVIEHQ
jgi:dTDP-4-dehydrorhamnose reductase